MNEVKQYAERDLMEMDRAGNHYCRHVDHMTREKLHSKSDIAAELGWRDMQIANLQQQLTATTNSLTNAQEALKSAGIEADTAQGGVMELVGRMKQVVAENAELKGSVEHAAGCIHAAEVEGLEDALERCDGERLADLVHRRLCHAYLPVETPSTDAYLNAVRAEGADKVADYHFVRIDALKEVSRQGYLFHKAAYSDAVSVANLLRASNAGKDGSHE